MRNWMPFDRVNYVGSKFNDLRTKMGEVVHIVKENGAVVVDFGEDQAVVCAPTSLKLWVPTLDKDGNEVEVIAQRRKKRKTDEEEKEEVK